uniref:Angiotensin-converting enzyme n=1 Tax=Romanomermis culicivorax TaxID=13658 RepID=A0A915K016_ROMCU
MNQKIEKEFFAQYCYKFVYVFFIKSVSQAKIDVTRDEVNEFLRKFEQKALNLTYNSFLASWIYNTNITDENQQNATIWETILSDFRRDYAEKETKLDESQFQNGSDIVRQIKFLKAIGYNLSTEDLLVRSSLLGNMTSVYGKATVCGLQKRTVSGRTLYVQNCSLRWALEPELTQFLKKNRNYEALQLAWKSWHDAAGKPIRRTYKKFIDLSNKGAKANGFQDVGDFWRFSYEDADFVTTIERLFFQILPLYENLFAFVRAKFTSGIYKGKFQGPAMPAHIFGNMWAQEWVNLMDVLVPYPKKSRIDVTDQMKLQNYTVEKMFHVADQFFQSLGMKPMPPTFWRYSMLKKPQDRRDVVCHASAWDFFLNGDVRIKMCTEIEMNDLITIHHEMGHVQYYLNYAQQPFLFRDGANPGFHEAIEFEPLTSVRGNSVPFIRKSKMTKKRFCGLQTGSNFIHPDRSRPAFDKVVLLQWECE